MVESRVVAVQDVEELPLDKNLFGKGMGWPRLCVPEGLGIELSTV